MALIRQNVDPLEFKTQTYQLRTCHSLMQCSVIETFAITQTVSASIKGDAGQNQQIQLSQLQHHFAGWFKNTETAMLQILSVVDAHKLKRVVTYARISNLFSGLERQKKKILGKNLVVDRAVQGESPCVLKYGAVRYPLLGLATPQQTSIRRKMAATCQHIFTQRCFGHAKTPAVSGDLREGAQEQQDIKKGTDSLIQAHSGCRP